MVGAPRGEPFWMDVILLRFGQNLSQPLSWFFPGTTILDQLDLGSSQAIKPINEPVELSLQICCVNSRIALLLSKY
jgi:hypothetical protein